jgi:hypothetical protein
MGACQTGFCPADASVCRKTLPIRATVSGDISFLSHQILLQIGVITGIFVTAETPAHTG